MSTIYQSIPKEWQPYVSEPEHDEHLTSRNYTFRITAEMEHSRGISWVANLATNGTIFAIAENHGDGGCNRYTIKNDELWNTFVADAHLAYGSHTESTDELVQLLDILTSN